MTSGVVRVNTGATLYVWNNGVSPTLTAPIRVDNGTISTWDNSSGANAIGGPVEITNTAWFVDNGTGTIFLTNTISGSGQIVKTGNYAVYARGSNTYVGATIVSSGYSNDPVMGRHREYGFCGVLVKPFQVAGLGAVLHEVLG